MVESIKLFNFNRLSKRMVSLLLVFVLSFSFLLSNVDFKTFAASYDDCSAAGDGSLKWSLSEDNKTLTFTGYGRMKDYTPMKRNPIPPPWLSAKDSITTIEFKSDSENGGITKIGNGAFVKFSKLKNIEFPESLEEIGIGAFTEASLLQITDLSNTKLKRIDDSAFTSCGNVAEIYLPGTVAHIGAQAFGQMRDLKAVYIIDHSSIEDIENLSIGSSAFDYNPIRADEGSASIIVKNEELKNAFDGSSNKSGYEATVQSNIIEEDLTQNLDGIIVKNGTTLDKISELLDENAKFRLTSGTSIEVPINWNLNDVKYDPDLKEKQAFEILGTFDKDPTVANLENATVKVEVQVQASKESLSGLVVGKDDKDTNKDTTKDTNNNVSSDINNEVNNDEDKGTNEDKETYDSDKFYKTGDNTNVAPLVILATLSLASLVFMYNRKREENK